MRYGIIIPAAAVGIFIGCASNQTAGRPTPSATSAVYGSEIVPVRKKSDDTGILRVTNHTREALQVFLTSASGDTYLRLIEPGASESLHVPGKVPGDTISLKAKTPRGSEYTTTQQITLSANSCTRNFGPPSAQPGCEWIVP